MNKEQILISLQEIRKQLPVDLIRMDYSQEVADRLANRLVAEEENLRKMTTADTVKDDLPEAIKVLKSKLEDAADELENARNVLNNNRAEKAQSEAASKEYAFKVERAKKRLPLMRTEEERKKLEQEIANYQSTKESNDEWAKESERDISETEAYVIECEEKYRALEVELDNETKKQIEVEQEEHRGRINDTKRNITDLRRKAGFLTTDIIKTIDDLITDYESGVANEREVNYRMGQIREALLGNSFISSMEEEETSIIQDQIDGYDLKIRELETKVSDGTFEREHQAKMDEIKSSVRNKRRNLNAQRSRYNANLYRISSLTEELNELAVDSPRRVEIEKEISSISKRNAGIASRMEERQGVINGLIEEFAVLESEKLDHSDELEKLKEEKEAAEYRLKMRELSIIDKINTLLIGTGSKIEDLSEKKDDVAVPVIDKSEIEDLGKRPAEDVIEKKDDFILTDEERRELGEEPELKPVDKDKVAPGPVFPIPTPKTSAGAPVGTSTSTPPASTTEDKGKSRIVSTKPAKKSLKEKLKKKFPKIAAFIAAALLLFGAGYGVAKNTQPQISSDPTGIYEQLPDGDQALLDGYVLRATEENMQAMKDLLAKCKAIDGTLYMPETYDPMMDQVDHIENELDALGGQMGDEDCIRETKILQDLYDALVKIQQKDDSVTPVGPGTSTPDDPTNPDKPVTPDDPTNPDKPVTPDDPTNPDKPVVDPEEEHKNDPDTIYLAPGDVAGRESEGTTTDYDGNQYENGEQTGKTDLDHTDGGYAVVDVDKDIADASEEKVVETPTGFETTDTSDLSEGEKENLDSAVEEALSDPGISDSIDWDKAFFDDGQSHVPGL